MKKIIKEKILKSEGYWKIIFHPSEDYYNEKFFLNTDDLNKSMQNVQVRFRGRYQPSFDSLTAVSEMKICGTQDYKFEGSQIKNVSYLEFDKSGLYQELHEIFENGVSDEFKKKTVSAIAECWTDTEIQEKLPNIKYLLEYQNTVWHVAEIFSFLSNLAQLKQFNGVNDFKIVIELHGVEGRMLFNWDLWGIRTPYICEYSDNFIAMSKTDFSRDEIINNYKDFAIDFSVQVLNSFHGIRGSFGVTKDIISKIQDKLYSGNTLS